MGFAEIFPAVADREAAIEAAKALIRKSENYSVYYGYWGVKGGKGTIYTIGYGYDVSTHTGNQVLADFAAADIPLNQSVKDALASKATVTIGKDSAVNSAFEAQFGNQPLTQVKAEALLTHILSSYVDDVDDKITANNLNVGNTKLYSYLISEVYNGGKDMIGPKQISAIQLNDVGMFLAGVIYNDNKVSKYESVEPGTGKYIKVGNSYKRKDGGDYNKVANYHYGLENRRLWDLADALGITAITPAGKPTVVTGLNFNNNIPAASAYLSYLATANGNNIINEYIRSTNGDVKGLVPLRNLYNTLKVNAVSAIAESQGMTREQSIAFALSEFLRTANTDLNVTPVKQGDYSKIASIDGSGDLYYIDNSSVPFSSEVSGDFDPNNSEQYTYPGAEGRLVTADSMFGGMRFGNLMGMLDERKAAFDNFKEDYINQVSSYYESAAFTSALQTALAQIVVRLAQGENFLTVMAQATAQVMASPLVGSLFDQITDRTELAGTNYQQYVSSALQSFVLTSILNGGEDMSQAAQNVTVQQAINASIAEGAAALLPVGAPITLPSEVIGGHLHNFVAVDTFLTRTITETYTNASGQTVTRVTTTFTPAGAGIAAAALTVASTVLTGGQVTQQTIGQATIAGTTAAAATAIGQSLAGTAFFSNLGIGAGPIGFVAGLALSYAATRLLSGSKTYHDETISHTIEIQPDGSLKVIGLRETGSLLRTTGTSNDDYIGNDSADDSTGHDVIVGQSGMNEIYAKGGHDFIEGRANDDYIDAGTGDDHVEAGSGDDHIIGGNGADRIYGQSGDDTILGGQGDDLILGGTGDDQIEGNEGNDQIFGGEGDDTIAGGSGADRIDGGSGADVLNGEANDDEISGGTGDDIIHGNDGNDLLSGGAGNDDVRGDGGNDIILGEDGVDQLYGGDGTDVLDGGNESDILFGGLGNDTLYGNFGDDSLYGEIGNDLIVGGRGNDVLSGGDGDDVFLYYRNDGQDEIQDSEGFNKLKLVDLNATDMASIAKVGNDLVLTFDSLNSITVKDHFLASGLQTIEFANNQAINVASMTFNGTTGVGSYSLTSNSNILAPYASQLEQYQNLTVPFLASTVLSTGWLTNNYDLNVTTDAYDLELYNDVQVRMWQKKAGFFGMRMSVGYYDYFERFLNGSGYADRIVGMYWAETIDGAANNDQLYGNGGADTVIGGSEHDLMFGGADNDIMQGQGGTDKIFGGTGNDTITGGEGNDTLYGEIGADNISGEGGDDYISGGTGNDTLSGGTGRDIIYGEEGDDTISGDADDDYLNGGVGNDTINAGAGDDLLFGGDGNDTLNGEDGNDILIGGKGTNTINGGAGTDTLVVSGRFSDYGITYNASGSITVNDNRPDQSDGINTLTSVEKIQFADAVLETSTLFPTINNIRIPVGQTYNGRINLPVGFTAALVQGPTQGSAVVNSNGTYSYVAPGGFTGTTSFQYKITSSTGIESFQNVAITTTTASASGGSYTYGSESSVGSLAIAGGRFDYDEQIKYTNSVSKLASGGYVVTWTSIDSDGTDANIYYRIYNQSGNAVTTAQRANSTTAGAQVRVNVTSTSNGDFIISWEDQNYSSAATGRGTWRRFSAAGSAVTSEIRVMPTSTGTYWDSPTVRVLELSTQEVATIWSGRMGPDDYDIYYRKFSSTGTALNSPVKINTTTSGIQLNPAVALLANGNLIVTWEDRSANDGSSNGVYGQIIDQSGTKIGSQFIATTTTADAQMDPSVSALAGGGFVVTWSAYWDASWMGTFGQVFNASGTKLGTQFQINTFTQNDQKHTSVKALSSGGFYVVFTSDLADGSNYGVYGQLFDASGNKVGVETRINDSTTNDQFVPDITELTNGDLVITWTSLASGSAQIMQKRLAASNQYLTITGDATAETLIAAATNDTISGGLGNDILVGAGGNDALNGGDGEDIAQFSGNRADYTISINDANIATISDTRFGNPDGVDVTSEVEILRFADSDLNISTLFTSHPDIQIAQSSVYAGAITIPSGFTASVVTAPASGSFVLNGNGTFQYTSTADYAGPTTFEYKLTGANGLVKNEIVQITVLPKSASSYTTGGEGVTGTQVTTGTRFAYEEHVKYASSITNLQGGNFVVTWVSNDSDGTGQNVYYRVYNQAGTAVTSTARVNTSTAGAQVSATVTALTNGGFAIAWEDQNPTSTTNGRGTWRVYNTSGVAQTGELSIMPTANGTYWDSPTLKLVQLSNGNVGAVWSGRMGPDDYAIYFSEHTLTGTKVGAPLKINTTDTGIQLYPSVTKLLNGNLAVVWEDRSGNDGDSYGVYAQIIDQSGNKVGSQFLVPTSGVNGQSDPEITSLLDGGFVVTWSAYYDASWMGVFAQVFEADGTRRGNQFQVNTFTQDDQKYSSVKGLADGGFFVVWTSDIADGSGYGVYGQRYDRFGTKVGGELRINDTTTNEQFLPDIAEMNNGDLMFTWTDISSGGQQMRKRFTAVNTYVTTFGTQNVDIIMSSNSNDYLSGGQGSDVLIGSGGNDTVDGGAGVDASQYSGNLANYTVSMVNQTVTVTDTRSGTPDGTDTLTNIEKLIFADQQIDLASLFTDLPNILMTYKGVYNGTVEVPAGSSITVLQQPGSGTLLMNTDGTFTYTAADNFSGTTSFTYKVTHGNGITRTRSVGVNVMAAAVGSNLYTAGTETLVADISINYPSRFNYDEHVRYGSKVIKLVGGGHVVAWTSIDSDGTTQNIYYRVYDASGNALTSATKANSTTSGTQISVSGTSLANGGFILNWEDQNYASATTGRATWRIFNASGTATSTEYRMMPTAGSGNWDSPTAEMVELSSGNIGAAWSGRMGADDYNIYYGVYTTAGAMVGSVQTVNTTTAGVQLFPSMTKLANGNIAVLWEDRSANDGSDYGILGQIIDQSGNKVGSQFIATTTTTDGQRDPSVTALANGNMIVTWSAYWDASWMGTFGQVISSTGSKIGTQFQVNTFTANDQKYTSVKALADGGFFVVWTSDSTSAGDYTIYGQRYDANANRIGGELPINTATTGDQLMPDIAELSNGDLMVSWTTFASGTAQIVQKRYVAPVGAGAGYTLAGTTGDDVLAGSSGNDILTGDMGNDILSGGAGNDTLSGGAGNDTYQFAAGFGQDTLNNADAAGTDIISFGSTMGREDIWFQQVGYNLKASVLGTTDSITLENWFTSDAQKVDQFKVNGYTLDKSKVDQLVSAMAGFNPQAIGAVTNLSDLPQGVQTTIAASWQ